MCPVEVSSQTASAMSATAEAASSSEVMASVAILAAVMEPSAGVTVSLTVLASTSASIWKVWCMVPVSESTVALM